MHDGFTWGDRAAPKIQSHSQAKLRLIKHYLGAYFDTVVPNPVSDRLHISLVDGFCGGGTFSTAGGETVLGTPLIMLNAVEEAQVRLNTGRRKKLKIEAMYYFIDKSPLAIAHLKNELLKKGYGSRIDVDIHVLCGEFQNRYQEIISDIQKRTRAGRSIFLLDQCGYNNVSLKICRDILFSLMRSEIILTFAIDWMIDYLTTNDKYLTAVRPINITGNQIKNFLQTKGLKGHRSIVQRLMSQHLTSQIGAPFFTPFFIRSSEAGRDLWLIHLSKHQTARNVMTSSHWAIGNGSIHQGEPGLDMLGFDPHWRDSFLSDFMFDDDAYSRMNKALQDEIPRRIGELDNHGLVTVDSFESAIANGTAARHDQIEKVLMESYKRKDIEIVTPTGKPKQVNAKLTKYDGIQISRQLLLPGVDF